jgi:xanthine dehydrogenase FAD-binding subunit
MRPQGVALPILNTAIWLEREGNTFLDVRIAFGPSGPIPRRATAAEDILRKSSFSEENIKMATEAMLAQVTFRTSPLRASASYRKHLSEILFNNVIKDAFERAIQR